MWFDGQFCLLIEKIKKNIFKYKETREKEREKEGGKERDRKREREEDN